ncbi:hypothetical protein K466DRAFT_563631 [Polyporus arcularius HHB13444]|uniref:DUF6532 domain-containing protein n=1 Tax=Polyporus arcularius HHB13444 TaxID=1314778 RepID=A0A5C3PME5_9APHY|nr:hypothetical protein K466DRAFT_563631 [Polyporus arcularius HHB13444]
MSGRAGGRGRGRGQASSRARTTVPRTSQGVRTGGNPQAQNTAKKSAGSALQGGHAARRSNKENEETRAEAADKQDGNQRPRRNIRATRFIDPELAQNLRPGHVQAHPMGQETMSASSDTEDEDEMGDLMQQQGIGSEDEDFIVPGEDTSAMPQISASVHGVPLSNSSARLDALRGPNVHSFPSVTATHGSGAIPSMVNPVAPFPSVPFLFSAPNSGQPLSQTSTLSLSSPAPNHASAQGPSRSMSESSTSPSPAVTTCRKRRSDASIGDDPDEHGRQEARARKQAERNAKRRRYKHFAYDGSLQQLIRRTGYILQAVFSSENPYPTLDEKDRLIGQAYEAACEVLGRETGSYTLTEQDMQMFRQEDTNIRSRVRREAAKLVPNDLNAKQGRFQHIIIGMVIDLVWFLHANALGAVYQEHFNPIRHETIALVLTAIHHVLSMYKEAGRRIRMDFTADSCTKYDEYIVALDQFDSGSMGQVWRRYRRYLFKRGLSHAGTEEEVVSEPVISLAPPEEMDREYARLSALVEKFKDISDSNPASDDEALDEECREQRSYALDSRKQTRYFNPDNSDGQSEDAAPQGGSLDTAGTVVPIDSQLMNPITTHVASTDTSF